jgi:radical SAM protein with 4Fe4S-binding SPASM domain
MHPLPMHGALPAEVGLRRMTSADHHSSCYFRTGPAPGTRKALIQITERCNLHCAHCFVSSTANGRDLTLSEIDEALMPVLHKTNVQRVTLTGGEPFAHPDLFEIVDRLRAMVSVTICTNATQIDAASARRLAAHKNVQMNVSIDGFNAATHDRLRGQAGAFATTMEGLARLAEFGLVKGILATPTATSTPDDFVELCRLGDRVSAEYVLMNPLSPLGRGVGSARKLGATNDTMRSIAAAVEGANDLQVEPVFIRFPASGRTLSSCPAGEIYYVFANGDVAYCPYLVFAARAPGSAHTPETFLAGNIFGDTDVAERLCGFNAERDLQAGANSTCRSCDVARDCGKGCPAAVVAAGGRVGDHDSGVCDRC